MDELLKKPCAFIIKMARPLLTNAQILKILSERDIKVTTMHLHIAGRDEGVLIIHCLIENDRMRSMKHFLEKFNGVVELEVLMGRNSNLFKETQS